MSFPMYSLRKIQEPAPYLPTPVGSVKSVSPTRSLRSNHTLVTTSLDSISPRKHGKKPRVKKDEAWAEVKEAESVKSAASMVDSDDDSAAEAGRKRSNALPSLKDGKHPNGVRKGHHTQYQGPMQEWHDNHWKFSPRNIRTAIDKRIVHHLRGQLNRRMERKLNQMFEDDWSDTEGEVDAIRHLKNHQQAHMRRPQPQPYHNEEDYEFADEDALQHFHNNPHKTKTPQSHKQSVKSSSTRKTRSPPHHHSSSSSQHLPEINGKPLPGINGHGHGQHSSEHVHIAKQEPEVIQYDDVVLPDIKPTSSHLVEDQSSHSSSNIDIGTELTQSKDELTDAEIADILHNKDKDVDSKDETHSENVDSAITDYPISPVPTPVMMRPETRENEKLSAHEKMSRILKGYMGSKLSPKDTSISIYIHSGITDSEVERTYLMQHVFPELKTRYMQRGYQLLVRDLHWGSRDFIADDHCEQELLQDTLDACKQSKRGVNFITFLAQKYGEPMLPSTIPKNEFESILRKLNKDFEVYRDALEAAKQEKEDKKQKKTEDGATASGSDLTASTEKPESSITSSADITDPNAPNPFLLQDWYLFDENAIPPVYKLARISTHYKDISSKEPAKRSQARTSWLNVAHRLHNLLWTYAQQCVFDKRALSSYNISASALELEALLVDPPDEASSCYWFRREFEGLDQGHADPAARDYLDIVPMRDYPDSALKAANKALRERLGEELGEANQKRFITPWNKNGIVPQTSRSHLNYVQHLSETVHDILTYRIDGALVKDEQQDPLAREVLQHVFTISQRAKEFHGCKSTLNDIKRYLRSPASSPFIIHGKAGTGKTALIAKAAKDAKKWLKNNHIAILVRMISLTVDSSNIRLLLTSLCQQICYIYGEDASLIPSDYKGLFNHFQFLLTKVNEERPLVIFLDSLHDLSDENDAKKLAWLPKELPENVHMIITCLPDEKYEVFANLKKTPITDSHYLAVPDLPIEDAQIILENWYMTTSRKITKDQEKYILQLVEKCPQPLYLKVMFADSLKWPSYLQAADMKFGSSVKSIATVLFARLERDHGEALVRRALGYITASKNGVTENEMEDLLSLDDYVMDDLMNHHKLPTRRLPVIYWVRLRKELDLFIQDTIADKTVTMSWSHIQFIDAAVERYMNQRDKAPSYHRAIGEYFLDMWYQAPKPYGSNEKGAQRYVSSQALYWKEKPKTKDPDVEEDDINAPLIYNYRRLSELPYQLLKSQQMDQLKSQCLCNFEFMLAKICATTLRELFEDLSAALLTEPGDKDLKLLSDTLHLSTNALTKDPRQLGAQLIGRLHHVITTDVPISYADPVKYPFLKPLFQQCHKSSIPTLIPSMTCLTPPGGILFDLLSGHTDGITSVSVTLDGQRVVTTSKDNTMKLWELRSGRVVRTFGGVGENVSCTRVGKNIIITSETNCLRVWDMFKGDLLRLIELDDPGSITTAQDGKYLVAFLHGVNTMKVWDISEHDIPEVKEVNVDPTDGGEMIHKDESIIVSPNSQGPLILHAFKSTSIATVRSVKTGNAVRTLKCRPQGSIQALNSTMDYFICAARFQYMQLHEIFELELFDVKDGKYVRSIRGCIYDNITDLFVNHIGSHAFAVNTSEAANTTDIAIFNLETEDHKHLAKHAVRSCGGACSDIRYCLTASKDESTLRVWNLSTTVNQPQAKPKAKEGIERITPMVSNPRYVVAQSVNNGPISVWNIIKGKCSGKAVQIERGLLEQSDILLVRDTRIIVLADKGIGGGSSVFQTVLIYDLRAKKYVQKLKGCFIIPCPAHEYTILDDDTLLGLSENRSHFVVWSFQTGAVTYRLKANFKKIQLEKSHIEGGEVHDKEEGRKKRTSTAKLMPWERRHETRTARERRRAAELQEEKRKEEEIRKERNNAIEQYLMSEDKTTIVASYFAHHLCVFDIPSQTHIQTLEDPNSMLYLHVSALTTDGNYLAIANYDEDIQCSFVTLWEPRKGHIKKRLKNERGVACLGISDDGHTVILGKTTQELRVWTPGRKHSLRKIQGNGCLNFNSESNIYVTEEGNRVIVYASDISLWDIEKGMLLAVFTPDKHFSSFTVGMNGKMIAFGQRDTMDVVVLKLMSKQLAGLEAKGDDLFGEASSSESEFDDDEEED